MTWNPRFRRQVPTGNQATDVHVVSLAPHGSAYPVSRLAYLQYVRSGMLKVFSTTGQAEDSTYSIQYLANVASYAACLASAVEQELGGEIVDAILEVPSSRDLNKPYTQAILSRYPNAVNLTKHLKRLGSVKSGEGASSAEVLADTIAMDLPPLENIHKLVIVDDVLGSGNAVGAVIARLQNSGLPDTCQICLAVPLVVFTTDSDV